jgi:hypothetical protein
MLTGKEGPLERAERVLLLYLAIVAVVLGIRHLLH